MSFKINTNVSALVAHINTQQVNDFKNSSLEKLSSGLRINRAADDVSGIIISNGLRQQSQVLGQSIKNANEGMNILQIADKAMDEQVKILDMIKVKATQAAQDGQNTTSRAALQDDITHLMKELDNIASTTSYNGLNLLSGQFTNKQFQIGGYSNESISVHIGATSSDKIGNTRFETSTTITASGVIDLTFSNIDGMNNFKLESVIISTSAGTGLGVLVETINKNSDILGGIHASSQVVTTGKTFITEGDLINLTINDIVIGDVRGIKKNDSDGKLISAINNFSTQTGVVASVDGRGHLELVSSDSRGIKVETGIIDRTMSQSLDIASVGTKTIGIGVNGTVNNIEFEPNGDGNFIPLAGSFNLSTGGGDDFATALNGIGGIVASFNDATGELTVYNDVATGLVLKFDVKSSTGVTNIVDQENYGRLTLTRSGAHDIVVSASGSNIINSAISISAAEASVNLRSIGGSITADLASAMGFNYNAYIVGISAATRSAGVTTLKGAMAAMEIADSARQNLDKVRASLGSTSNQLESTIYNISVTQVNVAAAESQIRSVDFASESAHFSKLNILSQAGNYALSQANATQKGIMQLLG